MTVVTAGACQPLTSPGALRRHLALGKSLLPVAVARLGNACSHRSKSGRDVFLLLFVYPSCYSPAHYAVQSLCARIVQQTLKAPEWKALFSVRPVFKRFEQLHLEVHFYPHTVVWENSYLAYDIVKLFAWLEEGR